MFFLFYNYKFERIIYKFKRHLRTTEKLEKFLYKIKLNLEKNYEYVRTYKL